MRLRHERKAGMLTERVIGGMEWFVVVGFINNKQIKHELPQLERDLPILNEDKPRHRAMQNYKFIKI